MSRVTYADTPTTADQNTLRSTHKLRPVTPAEEGTGVDALPAGVYGFTYSPGLLNAPLWSVRRYRTYEIHKVAGGDTFVIGFASAGDARSLASETREFTMLVHPEPGEAADALVAVPYTRIRQHRQYCAPNQNGFTVTILGR